MEAMAVRPELRFQGIQQFEDALNNKRVAEYPKVKIKKRKRRRNWILAMAGLLVLAVGVSIGLYSTVLKPENRIFDSVVAENTQIEIWVENQDQKEWLEALRDGGFTTTGGTDDTVSTGSELKVGQMQRDNQKVTYEVEVHENMEADLKKANESTEDDLELPNMFLSDHVADLAEYQLVSLKDNVYEALDTSAYEYMSEYEKNFPDMTEMPTGLNTLLLYHASIEYNQDNGLLTDNDMTADGVTFVQDKVDKDTGKVSFEDLIPALAEEYKADKELNPAYAVVSAESIPESLMLVNSRWQKVMEKNESPEPAMRTELMNILRFNQAAAEPKYMLNKGVTDKSYGEIYGNNIVSDVTFRGRMNAMVKEQAEKGANPVSDYDDAAVVTCQDKMLVTLSERFAITGTSTEDEQTACMRLLWVMLTQNGQDKKATSTGALSYPILRSCLMDFEKYNRKFGKFVTLVQNKNQCILVGRLTGAMEVFSDGLKEILADENAQIDDTLLQEYCAGYIRNNGADENEAQKGE